MSSELGRFSDAPREQPFELDREDYAAIRIPGAAGDFDPNDFEWVGEDATGRVHVPADHLPPDDHEWVGKMAEDSGHASVPVGDFDSRGFEFVDETLMSTTTEDSGGATRGIAASKIRAEGIEP